MAHPSNLSFQPHGDWSSIIDYRWRQNTVGSESGQNGNLVITDALKAEGPHRVNGWVRSGVPLYRDTDGSLKFWDATAKAAGKKCDGFTYVEHKITDVNGEFYTDSIPCAIMVRGDIYHKWLPVEFDPADLPPHFTNSIL